MNIRSFFLPAALCLGLPVCGIPGAIAQDIGYSSLPKVNFVAPDAAVDPSDPDRWMIEPEHRKTLNKQLLDITARQDSALRKSDRFREAVSALNVYDQYGQDFAYATLLQGDALLAMGGALYLQSNQFEPLFDPYSISEAASANISGYSLSPSGKTIAVGVGEGGAEIADVWFVDIKTREILDHQAGPVVVGGDSGFVWLDGRKGAFRKAETTDLVAGDPSVGAQWTLYDVRAGKEGAAVFAEGSNGVEVEFGDWFGLWTAAGEDYVLGYLWRGNYVDSYVASIEDVLSGAPDWTELAASRSLRDVEVWDGQAILITDEPGGESGVYLASLTGNGVTRLATGTGSLSYLYASAHGPVAYVFARDGADHVLFRLREDGSQMELIETPFEGEIDFGSFAPVYGEPGTVTFDMSSTDRPWRLMRLEPDGQAALADLTNLSMKQPDSGVGRARLDVVFAASDGGRDVPMSIIAPEGGEGPYPTLIHAYGSYGETTMNGWNPSALAWTDLGGLQAECHVRGSGYFGPQWHLAAIGPDKTAGTRDLIACAERLVELGLSEPRKIAVIGASAGGLVAGPAAIERPDLIGAAIVEFGVVNPLKGLEGPNGSTQIDEFGDPRKPDHAQLMRASDSVELSRDAAALPDIFLCVGFQDSRVPHWMSARLAAVMARRDLGNDIIFHADAEAGHSCGYYSRDQRDALAKQYTWLLDKFSD
ncbi:MAG: prolyl oligopeptidase family serine peptidase [Pseudomonadota bacterium]